MRGSLNHGRRDRRGMTLMELMVALAIMLVVTAVLMPSMEAAFMLQQRGAARRLALAFEALHDEAILRNRTYRIAFNLDDNTWKVEVGDPDVAVFDNDKARLNFEANEKELLSKLKPEDQAIYQRDHAAFAPPEGGEYDQVVTLPENTVFKSIYTPQREDPVTPRGEGSKRKHRDDPPEGEPLIVYSYVFANGSAEYTVIQIADKTEEDSGFTITVDPLSGKVDFHDELVEQKDMWRFLPDEGPRLEL